MTLSDLERRSSPYFAFSPNFIAMLANITSQWLKTDLCFFTEFHSYAGQYYVAVVKDRPMSVKYCIPVPFFHFGQT